MKSHSILFSIGGGWHIYTNLDSLVVVQDVYLRAKLQRDVGILSAYDSAHLPGEQVTSVVHSFLKNKHSNKISFTTLLQLDSYKERAAVITFKQHPWYSVLKQYTGILLVWWHLMGGSRCQDTKGRHQIFRKDKCWGFRALSTKIRRFGGDTLSFFIYNIESVITVKKWMIQY